MSARRFKGYRVGIIKPDGARRYMKPRSDGKWSLSETKPMLLDEDEMSDALDDVGDFMVGGDVSFSTPVFATRKPKPAPAEGAAEGRYAVAYQTATMPHAKMEPHVFLSRAQVDEWLAWNKYRADGVVRILPDGAHEAALAAARREERERVSPLLAALEDVASDIDGDYTPKMLVARFRKVARTALAAHEAAKGQAK